MRPQKPRGAVRAQALAAAPTLSRQHPPGSLSPKVSGVTHMRSAVLDPRHAGGISREELRCHGVAGRGS